VITEILAEEIHLIWMKWAKDLMKVEKISPKRTHRWHTCFVPYPELSEAMKEKDRKIARRLLKIVNNHRS
jgi:hypothetical protein